MAQCGRELLLGDTTFYCVIEQHAHGAHVYELPHSATRIAWSGPAIGGRERERSKQQRTVCWCGEWRQHEHEERER